MKNIRTIDCLLLELLKSRDYLSGEKLASKLNISRSAIHKRISKLRKEGFLINAINNKGVKIIKPYPFAIIPEIIYQKISDPNFFDIFFMEQASSTNTIAQYYLKERTKPFVLFVREQIQGRGRFSRHWEMSSDKDVCISFVVPANVSHDQLFSITQLASLAVFNVLSSYTDQCVIKWPNDILVKDGRKISGILTETILEELTIKSLIIGIGININSNPTFHTAVSLKDILRKDVDLNIFYAKLISEFINLWKLFPQNIRNIKEAWQFRLAWLGQNVQILHNAIFYEGIFKSVQDNGTIILEINGIDQEFFSGDLKYIT